MDKKYQTIIVLFLLALFASVLLWYFWAMREPFVVSVNDVPVKHSNGEWKSCDNLEQFINSAIQKANYCAKNEECVVSDVGELPCRCWSLVNKEAELIEQNR